MTTRKVPKYTFRLGPRAQEMVLMESSLPDEAERGMEPQAAIVREIRNASGFSSVQLSLTYDEGEYLMGYFEHKADALSGPGVDSDATTRNEVRVLRRAVASMKPVVENAAILESRPIMSRCVTCGDYVSTADDAGNPMDYCGDCGKPTCPDHRQHDAGHDRPRPAEWREGA